MKIGLDIMGGDFAPDTTVAGALLAQKELPPEVQIVLIGKEDEIRSRVSSDLLNGSSLEIVDARDVVEMGDSPTKALSQKRNSSISVGFRMLKKKELNNIKASQI